MVMIVEDGTVVPGANSYVSVDWADDYFSARANEVWTALEEPLKESLLILATDYIALRWGRVLLGVVTTEQQPLLFPRFYACDILSQYPEAVQKATCEYALRASTLESYNLAPDVAYDETGRIATQVKEKVGPIEEERKWESPNATSLSFLSYRVPDTYMATLVKQTSGRVVR